MLTLTLTVGQVIVHIVPHAWGTHTHTHTRAQLATQLFWDVLASQVQLRVCACLLCRDAVALSPTRTPTRPSTCRQTCGISGTVWPVLCICPKRKRKILKELQQRQAADTAYHILSVVHISHLNVLTDWWTEADGLIDWLTEWLTKWLDDWVNDCSTHGLIDWLTNEIIG